MMPDAKCHRAPHGWKCLRVANHGGPCAAEPVVDPPPPLPRAEPNADLPAALMKLARGHGRLRWHDCFAWSSDNFAGSRDVVALEFFGAEAMEGSRQMMVHLFSHGLPLPGFMVADRKISFERGLQKPQPRNVVVLELCIVKD